VLLLGWELQAFALQAPHPYIWYSAVLPAIALVAASPTLPRAFVWLAVLAMGINPLLRPSHLAVWGRCVESGSTPAVRDALGLSATKSWTDLDRVAAYLREQGVKDGEVLCYNDHTHTLYLDLGIRPPTRFFHIDQALHSFPGHTEEMRRELDA